MICPSQWLHCLRVCCSIKATLSVSSPLWPYHTSSNNGNLRQVFFSLLSWRDKQAIDESGVMHRLTGKDSTQPTVNMCRQDRISALAVRRCIYLPLTQTHNSTELQLPRLRGADNTCKRHHSQPLPAHTVYSLFFTLSVWTALHWAMFVISTAIRVIILWMVCECGWLVCVFKPVHSHLPNYPINKWGNTENIWSPAFCC